MSHNVTANVALLLRRSLKQALQLSVRFEFYLLFYLISGRCPDLLLILASTFQH